MTVPKIIRQQFLGGASVRDIIRMLDAATNDELNRLSYIRAAREEAFVLAKLLDEFAQSLGYDTPEKLR